MVHTSAPPSRSERAHAQGKGSLGFVAINNDDSTWSATFATGLPAGAYCNVIEGPSTKGICSGTMYVTWKHMSCPSLNQRNPHLIRRFPIGSDGSLKATIGPRQAIAVHTGALSHGTPGIATLARRVSVLFSESATTSLGEVSGPQSRELASCSEVLALNGGGGLNHMVEYLRGGQRAAAG